MVFVDAMEFYTRSNVVRELILSIDRQPKQLHPLARAGDDRRCAERIANARPRKRKRFIYLILFLVVVVDAVCTYILCPFYEFLFDFLMQTRELMLANVLAARYAEPS